MKGIWTIPYMLAGVPLLPITYMLAIGLSNTFHFSENVEGFLFLGMFTLSTGYFGWLINRGPKKS